MKYYGSSYQLHSIVFPVTSHHKPSFKPDGQRLARKRRVGGSRLLGINVQVRLASIARVADRHPRHTIAYRKHEPRKSS